MKTIAITVDETLIERMDGLSSKMGKGKANRSRIVREALAEYLARLERASEEERERTIFRRHRGKLARQTAALVKEQAKG